jgi:multiple sugar transport system permease protein
MTVLTRHLRKPLAPAAAPPAPSRGRRGGDGRAAALFVAPSTLGFAAFILLPLAMTVYYSFTNYELLSPSHFIGLGNYRNLFSDPLLGQVYRNTALFVIMAVPLNVGLGLVLAVALNRSMPRWMRIFTRAAYFFPTLVGLIFVAIIWQFFFSTSNGIFNYYLGLFGIGPVPWLSGSGWVIPSIVILDVWKNVGLAMIILLAGLQSIPASYYEAARVDGASAWRQFRSITVPLLSPQLFFVLTLYLIGAIKVFDSIVVLTGGGPGNDSRSIVMYIYDQAFQNFKFGYASAVSVSLLVIIVLVTAAQFLVARKWVRYV